MKVSVGVDFGTLSARALVAEIGTGRELGTADFAYPHGVMDMELPDGTPLPHDFALQHPSDYLLALREAIPAALSKSGARPEDVVGLGVDCTCSTLLPTDRDGGPLCFRPEFKGNPHAYAKLWKHHAAQPYADRLNAIARARGEGFLARYGGKASSEWAIPKIWETLDLAPEVYGAADRFVEAGDWIVWQLVGRERRSACMAGYKAFWSRREGYPREDFFAALDERLRRVVDEKLSRDILPVGALAGRLTPEAASLTGLPAGTPVAVAHSDAHVALAGAGVTETGRMLMIMGTSSCHIVLGEAERTVPGTCGVVEDGAMPGYLAYEAGQSCMGDHFAWFAQNCVPEAYAAEARVRGLTVQQLLTERARRLRPGESGLLALDWWNGNRSVLVDADLSGALFGMTLQTRPEEIYRALVEATAFGARVIAEAFAEAGVPVREVIACGGIAEKNPMLMQIYADVLGRELRVARSAQTPALGSAIFGAAAAGAKAGGYDDVYAAAREMGGAKALSYRPDPAHRAVYDRLYQQYLRLHDLFGRGGCDALKALRRIKGSTAQ